MRTQFSKTVLAAGIALALALTFSCSDSGGDDGNIEYGSVADSNGKTYKTVKIGNQWWMAENLNYEAEGSRCYEDNTANCTRYGRLYNWATAKTVCPSGWNLPSKDDWDALMTAVGGESTAGTKLKARSGWNENGNGTDIYGFAALPGGDGSSGGDFGNVNDYGYWWSASEIDAYDAYLWGMGYNLEVVFWYDDYKSSLNSVRCVKD